jgi:hypothetical protein
VSKIAVIRNESDLPRQFNPYRLTDTILVLAWISIAFGVVSLRQTPFPCPFSANLVGLHAKAFFGALKGFQRDLGGASTVL